MAFTFIGILLLAGTFGTLDYTDAAVNVVIILKIILGLALMGVGDLNKKSA